MQTKLIWSTPAGDNLIAYMARVSNPEGQDNTTTNDKLISYLVKNQHWSPLEMVDACFEINTTRDIGRQILRHRSFVFQEFSGRYQSYDKLDESPLRECRLQDTKNRQNSLETATSDLTQEWDKVQELVRASALAGYEWALSKGVAKEQARALLPEGLTSSRLYMKGSLRSWIHYTQLRCDVATQKEHRVIAKSIQDQLFIAFPLTMNAVLK
jgi:thymidylate synthase (FAD)